MLTSLKDASTHGGVPAGLGPPDTWPKSYVTEDAAELNTPMADAAAIPNIDFTFAFITTLILLRGLVI
jgi:hypothetical protein